MNAAEKEKEEEKRKKVRAQNKKEKEEARVAKVAEKAAERLKGKEEKAVMV